MTSNIICKPSLHIWYLYDYFKVHNVNENIYSSRVNNVVIRCRIELLIVGSSNTIAGPIKVGNVLGLFV